MSHSPSPPPTRQTRSDFDLEPNPFEQSFSVTPSSNIRNDHHPSTTPSSPLSPPPPPPPPPPPLPPHPSSSPPPILPPITAISSPSDQAYTPWNNYSQSLGSLRAGPLSPAMLAGPQINSDKSSSSQFDFRTGLTPRSGLTPRTGLTPGTGLTPLVGGPVAFPPSPGTSAFLAIISNGSSNQNNSTSDTITPNSLNVINPSTTTTTTTTNSNNPHQNGQQENDSYISSASNAATTAANGLFLLSQAHQELTKREEAQARANLNAPPPPPSVNTKRSTKRKSYEPTDPTQPPLNSSKRNRANSGPRVARRSSTEEHDDDDDMDDQDDDDPDGDDLSSRPGAATRRGAKKPETEEEKRRNFLERNRQAALKCRQRKKAWLTQLQAKVEYLTTENERLTSALVASRDEISRLSALVGGAGVVGLGPSNGGTTQPLSISVNMGAAKSVAVGGRGGAGYGY